MRRTAVAGLAALVVSLGACSSDGGDATPASGSPATGSPAGGQAESVVDAVAYIKQHGDDSGWYRLDPPSSTQAELMMGFGSDLSGEVTADGERIATRDPGDPGGYTIRDQNGDAVSVHLFGESFGWNPAGTLGAYNVGDFDGPVAVVNREGERVPEWEAATAEDGASGASVDPTQVSFESWVTDDALFATVDDSKPAIVTMDGDTMVVTPIDVDNPNYPVFDRQGNGIFVDETTLRHVDAETGEVTDLATLDPSPESDYIARNVSWSPVAGEFSVDTVDGSQICSWSNSLSCEPVTLPSGFVAQGAVFSLDGETVAYNGYVDGPGVPPWHPVTVDLSTMDARPLPFECSDTCYLFAYMASP